MKQLKTFLIVAAAICIAISCGRSGTGKKVATVTLPFDVTATCNYTYVGPDTLPVPRCEAPLNVWRAIVDGKGTGTPVGDFTVHFDFCGDSISNYGNVNAFMALSDGDTLFVSGTGRVYDGRLDGHPAYVVSYWRDPFTILGGTGKYKDATGNLTTDDYNSSEDPYSHHHWTGTITMAKGKK